MAGITEIEELLKSMSPELKEGEYVFCTVDGNYADYAQLDPIGTFVESEGLTLIITAQAADQAQLTYDATFRQITLTVHSSLEAVGLTAAISEKLASRGISANVVAAYYHDHIFVQSGKADEALAALEEFAN